MNHICASIEHHSLMGTDNNEMRPVFCACAKYLIQIMFVSIDNMIVVSSVLTLFDITSVANMDIVLCLWNEGRTKKLIVKNVYFT